MKRIVLLIMITALLGATHAPALADDTELFATQVAPDTLIILDMSRSMNFDVSGKNESASPPNRRIDIARKVLFDLLDDNDNNVIDADDEKTLEARLGYMRFRSATSDESGDPLSGNIRVLANVGSSFKDIWNKIIDPKEQNGAGGTPLAGSLSEAKTYFTGEYTKSSDPAAACRKKFVILITDGEDTYACSGNGSPGELANPGMYRRRMLTVQRAKELNASGIQVFVVGFGGDLPDELKKTLNWAAKYGGTDNPLEGNTGDTGAYDVTRFGSACSAVTNADPANYPLAGYAFLAEDAAQLSQALKSILGHIQERAYSFTVPKVPSIRLVDEDTLYLSSFTPSETPFWQGTLKAYRLNADGTLPVDGSGNPINPFWETSEQEDHPSSRRIYTTVGSSGATVEFTSGNLSKEDLGVTEAEWQKLINHIRGIDSYDVNRNGNTTEEREWKLGDIFHSSAVVVGAPSSSFEDFGFSGPGGYYEANRNRTKVIVVGANDGMLHAFNASTGKEEWAFIPNGVLKDLKLMAATHTYYVDASPKAADVWLYKTSNDEDKSADEWKTVLVCGLRKGGNTYFALDITDTKNPKFLWEFPKVTDTVTLGKVGQSWSEPAIGRVKVEVGDGLAERWVAFVGGGFDKSEGVGEANVGRAFFVIDIKTGEILWEFSFSGSEEKKNRMIHSFPAPPKAVDLNFDGFVDRVYLGDLGGQMWVFDVSDDEVRKKSNSQWNGKRLFRAPGEKPEKHPIYYPPAVALDPSGTPWVYWGTGDRESPTEKNSKERFYAVKDDAINDEDAKAYPYEEKDLLDVTDNNTFSQDSLSKGWFIKLAKSEKVLAKPTVFSRLVYFTTYTHTEPDPCKVSGEGRLYTVEYLSGGGAVQFSDLDYAAGKTSGRSTIVGSGVPSAPVITVSTKGKTSVIIGTTLGEVFSEAVFSLPAHNEILYWREVVP